MSTPTITIPQAHAGNPLERMSRRKKMKSTVTPMKKNNWEPRTSDTYGMFTSEKKK